MGKNCTSNQSIEWWENTNHRDFFDIESLPFGLNDMHQVGDDFERFSTYTMKSFPELISSGGLIESELLSNGQVAKRLKEKGLNLYNLLIKEDFNLPIAKTMKTRAGLYYVLKLSDELAKQEGILKDDSDYYAKLLDYKDFFNQYELVVITSNEMARSIVRVGCSMGYRVRVLMSTKSQGDQEFYEKYGATVEHSNKTLIQTLQDAKEHKKDDQIIVDEHDNDKLFLGASVTAFRLRDQLYDLDVDLNEGVNIYIPLGVGLISSGIGFGLKRVFRDNIHIYFVESCNKGEFTPLLKGEHVENQKISAVALSRMKELISGMVLVSDEKTKEYYELLHDAMDENFDEKGYRVFAALEEATKHYPDRTHIVWLDNGKEQ